MIADKQKPLLWHDVSEQGARRVFRRKADVQMESFVVASFMHLAIGLKYFAIKYYEDIILCFFTHHDCRCFQQEDRLVKQDWYLIADSEGS